MKCCYNPVLKGILLEKISLQKISLYNRTKEINEEKHKNKAFTKQKRRDIMIPTKPIA